MVGQGDWERAQFHAARCQEIALRVGDAGNWGNATALRFWTHHYQGDHVEADSFADAIDGGGAHGAKRAASIVGRALSGIGSDAPG